MRVILVVIGVLYCQFLLGQVRSEKPDAFGYYGARGETGSGVVDEEGNVVVPLEYERVELNTEYEFYKCYKGEAFDMVKPLYGRMHDFSLLGLELSGHSSYWLARTAEGTGVLGPEFEVVVPAVYDGVEVQVETFSECCMNFVVERDGKKGIYLDNTLALEPVYDEIKWLGRGYGILLKRDGKFGLVDEGEVSFHEVIPIVYDEVKLISGEDDVKLYTVTNGGLHGLFIGDYYGEPMGKRLLVPAWFEKLDFNGKKLVQDTWYVLDVVRDGRKGHVVLGSAIIESPFTYVLAYKESVALGMLFYQNEGNLWGAMNSSGPAIRAEYEEMMGPEEFFKKNKKVAYSDDFIAVRKGGLWGAIDSMGGVLVGFEYKAPEEIRYGGE